MAVKSGKAGKAGNINDYKDRFSSPIGVKNFVPPKQKKSTSKKSGKK